MIDFLPTSPPWREVISGDGEQLILGDADTPPNSPDADEDDFASRHSNGATFLLADGAVCGIADSIDLSIWRGLATRAGAEPGGEF